MLHLKNLNILSYPEYVTEDHDFTWQEIKRLREETIHCTVLYTWSVHCESNLITVQQDATYSVYYISVGSTTHFECWHPSSGAHTTVITASGID